MQESDEEDEENEDDEESDWEDVVRTVLFCHCSLKFLRGDSRRCLLALDLFSSAVGLTGRQTHSKLLFWRCWQTKLRSISRQTALCLIAVTPLKLVLASLESPPNKSLKFVNCHDVFSEPSLNNLSTGRKVLKSKSDFDLYTSLVTE